MPQKFFKTPFAANGDKEPIPLPQQNDGKISYEKGYTYEYERDLENDPLALPMEREKFNQLHYDITSTLQDHQIYAYPPYITPQAHGSSQPYAYPKGGVCRYDDGTGLKAYISTVADNKNTPSVNGQVQAGWAKIMDSAQNIVFENDRATSSNYGVARFATDAEAFEGVSTATAVTPYQLAQNRSNSVIVLAALAANAPTGSFVTGDKYYNLTSKQIFNYVLGAWGNPETPESGVIYENRLILYMWNGADLVAITGNHWPPLSMLVMPCALKGDAALGWTPQGGQVTNAMSPQLYQQVLAEYTNGTTLQDEVEISNIGGESVAITVPCRRSASTGLKIVDVADRAVVDELYAKTGSAFYIVLDRANAVFYLPRFTDGATFTGDVGQVGVYGKDQIVNIKTPDGVGIGSRTGFAIGGDIRPFCYIGSTRGGQGSGGNDFIGPYFGFNTSLIANTGDRVQGRNIKLFVYFRTSDRIVNAMDIDFGEIQAALSLKANTDLSNIDKDGQNFIISTLTPDWSLVENKSIDTLYVADVAGWLFFYGHVNPSALVINGQIFRVREGASTVGSGGFVLVDKGDTYTFNGQILQFIPCRGANQ